MNSKSLSNRGPPDIALDENASFVGGAANALGVRVWPGGFGLVWVKGAETYCATFANFKSPFVAGTVRKRSRNAVSNLSSH